MYIYDNTCDMYIYNKENVMLMTICYFCDYVKLLRGYQFILI